MVSFKTRSSAPTQRQLMNLVAFESLSHLLLGKWNKKRRFEQKSSCNFKTQTLDCYCVVRTCLKIFKKSILIALYVVLCHSKYQDGIFFQHRAIKLDVASHNAFFANARGNAHCSLIVLHYCKQHRPMTLTLVNPYRNYQVIVHK